MRGIVGGDALAGRPAGGRRQGVRRRESAGIQGHHDAERGPPPRGAGDLKAPAAHDQLLTDAEQPYAAMVDGTLRVETRALVLHDDRDISLFRRHSHGGRFHPAVAQCVEQQLPYRSAGPLIDRNRRFLCREVHFQAMPVFHPPGEPFQSRQETCFEKDGRGQLAGKRS